MITATSGACGFVALCDNDAGPTRNSHSTQLQAELEQRVSGLLQEVQDATTQATADKTSADEKLVSACSPAKTPCKSIHLQVT